MSLSPQSPRELAAREAGCRELINERLVLTLRERDLLNVVLNWSLPLGREWAVFGSIEKLGKLANLDRPHASTILFGLEERKLVQCVRRRGDVRVRLLPTSGDLVEPELRTDPKELALIVAETRLLNAVPAGFEPGGQKLLPIVTSDEQLANEHAAMSRERGTEMLRQFRESGGILPYRIGTVDGERTESVLSERTESVRSEPSAEAPVQRARARHDHDNEEPTALIPHDHERNEPGGGGGEEGPLARPRARWKRDLTEFEFEIFDRFETGLVDRGEEMTATYEQIWCRRIRSNAAAARDAIDDALRRQNAGKITSTLGGLANRLWKDYSGEQPYQPASKR